MNAMVSVVCHARASESSGSFSDFGTAISAATSSSTAASNGVPSCVVSLILAACRRFWPFGFLPMYFV